MEEDEDSQKSLLSKKKSSKAAAARQRTQQRFEALLNVGSGSEEVSEVTPRKSKKKARTKTADDALTQKKQSSPSLKKKSKSQENLLNNESYDLTKKSLNKNTKTSSDSEPKRRQKNKRALRSLDNDFVKQNGTDNNGYDSYHGDLERHASDDNTVNEVTEIEQDSSKAPPNRKKKKKKKVSNTDLLYKAIEKKRHDDGLLLCVIIHKADQLHADYRIQHPVVQIHIVNLEDGQYLKKTDRSRNVTSVFESQNESIDYIMPVMTQPYEFKKHRSFTPLWSETLIYNEVYSYFLQREQNDPPVIVFFELMDFVLMNTKKKDISKTEKGWHKIAWAFLTLVSPSGATNTDKKARLQFFKPINRMRLQPIETAGVEIYQWWKTGSRVHYPSTLTVTVKGVFPPEDLNPSSRSMYPTQSERGVLTFDELNSELEVNNVVSTHEASIPLWTKMPGQVNRIPNELKKSFATGVKGCSVVRFSNDGRYIACACATSNGYPIKIYQYPEGDMICELTDHFGIIYDLTWSSNDKELLSSSADSTVRCWDSKRFHSNCVKLFPHPSFVYVARYHPVQPALVVTGCFDRYVRIWNKISDNQHATLLREVMGHKGYVNTLTFLSNGETFFSGDSSGVIIQWHCNVDSKKQSGLAARVDRWKIMKVIELMEVKNVVVSTLIVHPGQMKVLIHSTDSVLRMLDLRSYGILKTYVGGFNSKEHIHAAFSNCGSFIFCGTENGLVNVWNTETGDHVYTYQDLHYLRPVTDIHFHKHDNYVAFCCYGDGSQPVHVYQYNPQVHLDYVAATKSENTEKSKQLLETEKNLNEATEMFQTFRETTRAQSNGDRIHQLEKKLQSVFLDETKMASSTNVPSKSQHKHHETMLSTWGSDFGRTNTLSPAAAAFAMAPPSSPHVNQYLGASARYRSGSPNSYSRSGSIDMYLGDKTVPAKSQLKESNLGRPVFTFNRKNQAVSKTKFDKSVTAIYEYKANRADELHLYPNDKIKVLYEDSADWWMGELEDGQQGYFPVSYVHDASDNSNMENFVEKSSHSAVVDKHGAIKFMTIEQENSEEEQRSRKKKKRKKRKENENETTC